MNAGRITVNTKPLFAPGEVDDFLDDIHADRNRLSAALVRLAAFEEATRELRAAWTTTPEIDIARESAAVEKLFRLIEGK